MVVKFDAYLLNGTPLLAVLLLLLVIFDLWLSTAVRSCCVLKSFPIVAIARDGIVDQEVYVPPHVIRHALPT